MINIQELEWWAMDPHVHCRDEEESYKTTISETLQLAREQGISVVCDMPNTANPVINRIRVHERLALVPDRDRDEGRYRLYVGLTDDPEQIAEAVWCYKHLPEVIGLKLYMCHSIGGLAVSDVVAQTKVFKVLTEIGFSGVVACHCEREDRMNPGLWSPQNPISHCRARPPEAEIESIRDILRITRETGFSGHVHVCHVSEPHSVELVQRAKGNGRRISCGVTPHHLMLDMSDMVRSGGLRLKVNPPLRSAESVRILRQQLEQGMIDVIETDHAPHGPREKCLDLCLSGIQSLDGYLRFVTDCLPALGLSPRQIKGLTADNVLTIFEKL